jgi:membrane-bound ClpP family serine protease
MDTLDYSRSLASKAAERAVIRDVWLYTALLAVVLILVGAFMTGSFGAVALIGAICVVGGSLITLITHNEYESARRSARPPRIHRIFD